MYHEQLKKKMQISRGDWYYYKVFKLWTEGSVSHKFPLLVFVLQILNLALEFIWLFQNVGSYSAEPRDRPLSFYNC